jgi:Putative auto-transporter adhesin, head GIN domain
LQYNLKQQKLKVMKKQILVTLVLMLSVFTSAFAENKFTGLTPVSKKISVKDQIQKIVVEGNVDVVLFEDNNAAIYLFGNTSTTSVSQKNNVLTVKNTQTSGEKTLVYIPVTNIREIEVNDNAKVSSAGPLISGELTVYVNGDCHIDLKATGKINLVEGEDVEMIVEKNRLVKGREIAHL